MASFLKMAKERKFQHPEGLLRKLKNEGIIKDEPKS
jgi:hypothetical protein